MGLFVPLSCMCYLCLFQILLLSLVYWLCSQWWIFQGWVVRSVLSVVVGCVSVVCWSSGRGGGGSWRLVYLRGGDIDVRDQLWVLLWGDLGLFSVRGGGGSWLLVCYEIFFRGSGSAAVSYCVLHLVFRQLYPPALISTSAFLFLVESAYIPFMVFSLAFWPSSLLVGSGLCLWTLPLLFRSAAMDIGVSSFSQGGVVLMSTVCLFCMADIIFPCFPTTCFQPGGITTYLYISSYGELISMYTTSFQGHRQRQIPP